MNIQSLTMICVSQTQAASQEALDQIKATNEANLRSQLEQKIRELECELGRVRTAQRDTFRDSTRTELERYRQLYTDEQHLRRSLAAKLDRSECTHPFLQTIHEGPLTWTYRVFSVRRANSRLADANSKLLSERSKTFLASSFVNSSLGGAPLDVSSLGLSANYGTTPGHRNRSFGLGLSLLNPGTEGQNSGVEDYLAKVCRGRLGSFFISSVVTVVGFFFSVVASCTRSRDEVDLLASSPLWTCPPPSTRNKNKAMSSGSFLLCPPVSIVDCSSA